MKKQLITLLSIVGSSAILSACVSENCAQEAKADFDAAKSAYEAGDFKKSFSLFINARDKNCVNADFYIAAQYYNGQFVTKDVSLAKVLFKRACDKGLKKACTYQ